MRLTNIARSFSVALVLGLLPGSVLADTHDPAKEGVELMNRLEESARNVRSDVADLQSLSKSALISPMTHKVHLNRIKDRVNGNLQPTLARLQEIQGDLPAWQQDAVDKLLTSSVALAQDTTAAIEARNHAGSMPPVLDAEYRDFLSRMYGHSEILVQTSDAAGAYADGYRKAIAAELAVPES